MSEHYTGEELDVEIVPLSQCRAFLLLKERRNIVGLQDRDFKGVWIPKEIWLNNELSVLEKVLFAEIDSLDGEDGCYASNDYFMEFFNVSESTISRGISKLKSLGYIDSVQIGGRSRILRVVKMTTQSSQNDYPGSSKNCVSSIKEKKENNIIYKSTLPGAPSKNHSQLYKAKSTLTDDLESGKSIDEQTKVKKRQTEEEKADKKIDKTSYSDKVKELLKQFFRQSFYSKDVKRMKNASDLTGKLMRLDELVKKGEDPIKVVQQSIDMNWNAFYEYKEQAKVKSYSDHSDGIIAQTLSQEEAREVLKGYAERNGVV